ncbi:SsrA-binding protein [Paraphotobacterium marinum]|uniref:SsrA-binding protein n=1 Tax=Paraphotobacterium marinum TaxID=1755811 RepID=A0A220VE21_9GAMM|nr:SsrA-binding protein SmpB [Paraphotobacterium marinum]ASK78412.1 SsrA-binding protein [Paraphotobacterium marinum]
MAKQKNKKVSNNTIAKNKKARFEFAIHEEFESGLELQGWEVKSIREGKVNLSESFVQFHNNELFLMNSTIQPLNMASTHVISEPLRRRKLLLNHREISKIFGLVNRDGYTIVALSMYWKKSWVKLKIGVAKGKKLYDKRKDIKDRDWSIDKSRILKKSTR